MNKGIEHYVTQSYLRRFANYGEHFYALDKTTGRVFPANVRDVAAEHDFFGEEIR